MNKIKSFKNNLLIIVLLLFLANQYFLGQVFSQSKAASTSSFDQVRLPADASLTEVMEAIIPQTDTVRPYQWNGQSVTLSVQRPNNGYDMLVEMYRSIQEDQLDSNQKTRFGALAQSIYHPCCDAAIGNCGCKHAIADKGLIKYLLSQDWEDDRIFEEVFLWQRYWWPRHYTIAALYLQSQGINSTEISAKEWLSAQFSTLRAGRKMKAELGI